MRLFSKVPLSLLQGIATGCAQLTSFVGQVKTLNAIQLNIEIAFPHLPPQQRKAIAKQAMINEVKSYFEFIHIWGSCNQQNIKRIHHVYGEHYLQQALQQGQGAVLIVPHFGTWEIMNAWLSQYMTLTIMYKPIKNPHVDEFVRQARSREHAHLVPTNETGVKQIFKALRQGGMTAILPDHSPNIDGGDLVNWFGVPLYSSHLSAKMIQKTRSAALLLYAIRNDNAGFDLYIEPVSDEIYHAQQQGTLMIHQILQQLIQRYPQHYHWSYKRFNASPDTGKLYTMPHEQALQLIREIQTKQYY